MRVSSTRNSAKVSKLVLLIISMLCFAVSTFAQSEAAAADLSGTVTDPSGAVVS